MKILYASFFGLVLASTSQNNAMKKVISLLEGMKATIEEETAAGKKDAEEYADWCIKAITETEADIKYGSEKVEELAAVAEDGAAQAAAKASEAAECGAAIGKSQGEQKDAEEARKKEHQTFVGEEAELVEADTMLGKAYSVLKRSLSLMQAGHGAVHDSYTAEVVAALGQIIESAWVDSETSNKLTAFLEDTDSLSLRQPQATTSNYDSKSGGILDAIQQMQEKNAEVLSKLREKEMGSRHAYELLMQDLKNTVENKGEQMAAAKEAGAKADAKGKEAEAAGAEASDTLASDKKELQETKAACAKAAREWATREADVIAEMGVIAKAVEILSGKFGTTEEAFIQVSTSSEEEARFARRQQASQLLRRLGREYNQFALIQAAQSAQDDPFVKVRGMISEMITKLEEEQRKEASKEAKCKADKAKGEKDLKNKKADFEKLMSREDGAKAKIAKLGQEVADLNTQLQELAASMKEATALRAKEKKENDAVIKDSADSIEALSGAIKVLSDFYGADTALVQTSQPKSDSANVIIEMLQTAQEDFEKLKQETEAAEASGVEAYEKLTQEAAVTKTKKDAMIEGKTNEQSSVKVQLSQISEDLVDAEKALTAANDFLKGVKEACANKSMSFEERQKRRGNEIAGLREALEILSSDESLLQTDKFLAKRI